MNRPLHCTHNLDELQQRNYAGWTFQLLCHKGYCRFLYANRSFIFRENCDIIIVAPEKFKVIEASPDLEVSIVIGKNSFVHSRLPANHFGVGGNFLVFENPVLELNEEQALIMSQNFSRIFDRIDDTDNPFYTDLIASLMLTLIYDSFLFLYNRDKVADVGMFTVSIVERLIAMLQKGEAKQHRDVGYYARQLKVSQKYLSDTVRRKSGVSVTYLINQYAIPHLAEYLRNQRMTLSQIADEFSFSSVSYLSRYVKKHFGMTATAYRASFHAEETTKITENKAPSIP